MSTIIEPTGPAVIGGTSDLERVDSLEKPLTKRLVTLGTIRYRYEHTNEIILIPAPAADR